MVIDLIVSFLKMLENAIPAQYANLWSASIYAIAIIIYAVFVWKFYRFLADREIIKLNLKVYNNDSYPLLEKCGAIGLYTLEYLIILPFLVLAWFVVLSLFLLILSELSDTQQILIIATAIILSTRITAYIHEDLSRDLAKILPFTILAIFIINPQFLDIASVFSRLAQLPALIDQIVIFVVFIFAIEFSMRLIYSFIELIKSKAEL